MAFEQTPILGLIGGVGCGKSAVADWLHQHVRARVVDADAIGHAALLREDVKTALRKAFGDRVFSGSEVDRSAVAARVFGDAPEHQSARRTLESIVYPVMRGEFQRAFESARADAGIDLIVFDAAVLLESGWQDVVDVIAYIDVPDEERLRRVTSSRGWSEAQLQRREASQWPLARKRAAADVVIDNSGTIEAAGRQLEEFLRSNGWLPAGTPIDSSTHQLIN